jgi:hypothetical protein
MTTYVPLTREQMLAEMDQALDEEIAKKSSEKSIKHSATDGKLLSEGNGQYIYQFTLTDPWTPDDDAPLTIANEAAKGIRCSVVNSTGTLLTIAADKALPPEVLRQIDLSDDSTELLRRQKQALKEADEGQAQLASKSFALVPSQQLMAESSRQFGHLYLRDAQHQAAQMALGGEVTFIVGPPGTGKTMTLVAIAFQLLQKRRMVLIAAHTNIAIDNAIMKLCEMCKEAGRPDLLANGQVVRYGAVQKAELKNSEKYVEVYLPKIAQRLGVESVERQAAAKAELEQIKAKLINILQQQQARIELWERQRSDLADQVVGYAQELVPLEQEEQRRIEHLRTLHAQYTAYNKRLERETRQAEQEYARVKAQEAEKEHELGNWQQQEQHAVARLVEARAMSNIKRFFKGIKIESLEARVAQCGQKTYEIKQALAILKPEVARTHYVLATRNEEWVKSKQQAQSITEELNTPSQLAPQIADFKAKKAQLEAQLAQVTATIEQEKAQVASETQALMEQQANLKVELEMLDQQLRDVEKSIVEKALVVGTTLTKTYMNQTIAGRSYEAVILDEVSMAPMPLVYLAATHAERSVTLIGDPQQLAPIVTADKPMAQKWLGMDLFNLRNISLQAAKQNYQHSVLLDVQSRMHPCIANVANRLVYRGLLRDDFRLSELKQITPLPAEPLVLCNTQDAYPIATRPANNKSWKNYYQALCCVSLARRALEECPELKKPEPTVGIVTPYRAQAQLLQSLLKDAGLHECVQAGTIHRFQGLEFDVLIFDTVESSGSYPGDFIMGGDNSGSMRLLNVAATRARQKLIIVANRRFVQEKFQPISVVRRAIEMIPARAVVSSLGVVGTPFSSLVATAIAQRPAAPTPAVILERVNYEQEEFLLLTPAPEGKEHLTDETFFEAFKRDVGRATKSILIGSPFLTEARVNDLLPLLINQYQKGVDVTIVTRPPEESSDRDKKAVTQLENKGLNLVYLPKMHQKAVIIDESILYHGSLNVLSHRDTRESMLRLTDITLIKDTQKSLLAPPTSKSRQGRTLSEAQLNVLRKFSLSVVHLPPATKTCGCGSALVPRVGKDAHAFYGCSTFRGCTQRSIENLTLAHIQQVGVLLEQRCHKCGSVLTPELTDWPQRLILACTSVCGEIQKVEFTR